jgi:hypothetical protein
MKRQQLSRGGSSRGGSGEGGMPHRRPPPPPPSIDGACLVDATRLLPPFGCPVPRIPLGCSSSVAARLAALRKGSIISELSPSFEAWVRKHANTIATKPRDDRRRAPLPFAFSEPWPRVLVFMPSALDLSFAESSVRPTGIDVLSVLTDAARRLNISLDILTNGDSNELGNKTFETMHQLQCMASSVFTHGSWLSRAVGESRCGPNVTLRRGRCGAVWTSAVGLRAHLEGRTPTRRYDAVVSWAGFELEKADVLTDFFGRPCPAVVTAVSGGAPPAGCARYLGRHKVHEGRKELVRELLSNTSAHVPSLTIARAEGLNVLLKEGRLDAPGGPCFPCYMKPNSFAGGSSGYGLRALMRASIYKGSSEDTLMASDCVPHQVRQRPARDCVRLIGIACKGRPYLEPHVV